jgi:hypothetical protein
MSTRSTSPVWKKNASAIVVRSMTSSSSLRGLYPSENVLLVLCVGVLLGFDGALALRDGEDGVDGM